MLYDTYFKFFYKEIIKLTYTEIEPTVRILSFPLLVEFFRHCVLISGTQRRAFASLSERGKELINILFPRLEIDTITIVFTQL